MALQLSHAIVAAIGLHVLMSPASAVQGINLRADPRYQVCAALATDRVKKFMSAPPSSTIRQQDFKQEVEIKAVGYQKLRSSKPQASVKHPESFMQHNQCEDEPIITSALQNIGNLNLTALELDFLNESIGLKIRIQNQQVSFQQMDGTGGRLRKRVKFYVEFLDRLLNEVELPDMEFVASLLDGGSGHPGVLRAEGRPGEDLLFLSRGAISSWWNRNGDYRPRGNLPKCKTRPGAVFRGSTTGGEHKWDEKHPLPLYGYDGQVLPRYRVIETSQKRPDLLDAGFTEVVQSSNQPGHTLALKERGFMKESLPASEQVCFEAVVVVDGNTIPDRLPEELSWARPVVFVHDSKLPADFYYDEMIPWEHYVPASPDNLEEVLEALLENKEMMDCIGANGRAFVRHRLSPNRLKCYMTKLLLGYHDLKQSTMDTPKAVVRRLGQRAWERKPSNWR